MLKEDNRSVSILPTLSKSFQMMFLNDNVFSNICFLSISKYQCRFWKGYGSQTYKLKKYVKKVKKIQKICLLIKENLLIDLSKVLDCLDHNLLTDKLNAYSFNLPALRLIHDYLSNRKQKNKN